MPPWLPPLLVAPFIGSFLGVVIRRLPAGRGIARGRSMCECGERALAPAELVPLASFCLLRGRCRRCGRSLPYFYPAVELSALLVPASAALAAPSAGAAWFWLGALLGWTLLALAWIDYETWRLPDALTLPLVAAGLAAAWWDDPAMLGPRAAGAAAGYLGLRLLGAAYRRLRGREGLGQGDAKLLAACGAWAGIAALPAILLAAALLGLLTAAVRRLAGERLGAGSAIQFGPCLAAALWLAWLGLV